MKKYIRFFFICGMLLFLSEIWKQYCITFIINEHRYDWWHFPFQLCSIPMYACLLLPFTPGNIQGILLAFLKTFGLMGGIFTFFDTSGLHYPYAPLTVHSYLWHVLLILIGIAAGICQSRTDLSPTCSSQGRSESFLADTNFSRNKKSAPAKFWKSALLYAACCVLATIFNIVFHPYGTINMFYISPYYTMEQKVFKEIARAAGNPAGIIIYIAACITGAYLIFRIWTKIGSFANSKAP